MTENYLTLLEESLQKKIEILEKIQEFNLRQQECFQGETPELESFDSYVEEKGWLIEQLGSLDEGFESLYEKVSAELKDNREKYKVQIKRLQELVAKVTEMGVTVEAQEVRNKKLVEQYFAQRKSGIKQGRVASRVAYGYYKNMTNTNHIPPQYMDSKQ